MEVNKLKAIIICASRYGSTLEIGRWIGERLQYEGISAQVVDVKNAGSLEEYDIVVLGSGIYYEGVLKELKTFVEKNLNSLKKKKIVLFGVAIETTPVFYKGKILGGLLYLKPLIEMLKDSVIHAEMLHGELVPQKLSEEDREALLRFYKTILKLPDEEIQKRLKPRTYMDKKEAWKFAETIINKIKTETKH